MDVRTAKCDKARASTFQRLTFASEFSVGAFGNPARRLNSSCARDVATVLPDRTERHGSGVLADMAGKTKSDLPIGQTGRIEIDVNDERIPGECAEGRPSLTLAVQK